MLLGYGQRDVPHREICTLYTRLIMGLFESIGFLNVFDLIPFAFGNIRAINSKQKASVAYRRCAMNLPISGDTHYQERRSALAFSNLVPADLFIIREENGRDYGVDRILELRFSGKAITNFRAHSQLKSVLN